MNEDSVELPIVESFDKLERLDQTFIRTRAIHSKIEWIVSACDTLLFHLEAMSEKEGWKVGRTRSKSVQ